MLKSFGAIFALVATFGILTPDNVHAQGCVNPPAGLVGWWPGEGTAADVYGGRDATEHDGVAYGAGKVGQAFALDGTNDYLSVADTPALDVGTSDWAISLWVEFFSLDGEQILAEKLVSYSPGEGWTLTKRNDTILFSGVGGETETGLLGLTTGTWYHVVARRAAGTLAVFVNDVVVATGTSTGDMSSSASLKFGHRGSPSDTPGSDDSRGFFLNGRIDEVMYFIGSAPSDAEIQAIYEAGANGVCPPTPVCGDGRKQGTEQCDDGNLIDDDACRNDCTLTCGDGVRAASEECDDGNLVSGDGCDENCTVTRCGNGIVTAGEECDDGNAVETDACLSSCRRTADSGWDTRFAPAAAGGLGLDGYVLAVAVVGNDVYVGGGFTTVGGTSASHVAKWDGSHWSAVGSGTNDVVNSLAVIGTDLYAAGDFTTAGGVTTNRIARWNGTSWSAVGAGMNASVAVLAASGTTLYAGGSFTTVDGVTANRIAAWNGSTWSALGSGMNNDVWSLLVYGTDLYAGGAFTTAGGGTANRIAKWNGSAWSALGSGIDRRVFGLAVFGGSLYAGGEFHNAGGVATDFIARWNGNNWIAVPRTEGDVHTLLASGNSLFAGGDFSNAFSNKAVQRWDGGNWRALGTGIQNGVVAALAVQGTDLIAGGSFATAGGRPSSMFAIWHAVCGNGFVDIGEQCDDANANENDGCFSNCSQTCGNGVLDAGEGCDDGNVTSGDGCDANCKPTGCGNGVKTAGEQCDDGNTNDTDACANNCTLTCGNGSVGGSEACDDGNLTNGDGCDANCTLTACGNGIVTAGEQCDDGNAVDTDGCLSNCTWNHCGDGAVYAGVEQCDDGNLVNGDGCDTNCTISGCGNEVVAAPEQCDDGNITSGDGCDENCTWTACGNGVASLGEACDDGNASNTDGCLTTCELNLCGDGFVNVGVEPCDDGNAIEGDGCDSNCTLTGCGNGIVTAGEGCDDGNAVSGDGCDSNCTPTGCGNGIATSGEACDDGNAVNGDGCDNNCTVTRCGNGIVSAGEICDDGNGQNGDGCDNNCTPTACGNGVRSPGEQCDDGNLIDGDGCQSNCQRSPGQLDPTFDGDGIATGAPTDEDNYRRCPVVVLGDGRIVAAYTGNQFGPDAIALAAYNTDGSVDAGFGAGGVSETPMGVASAPLAMTVLGGKLVVAGWTDDGSGQHVVLARYDGAGAFDPAFGQNGIVTTAEGSRANAVAADPSGKLVVAGRAPDGSRLVARYLPDGSLDHSFDGDGIVIDVRAPEASSMAIQPDGKIVTVGLGSIPGPSDGNLVLARYNGDGSIDHAFGTDGLRTIATQAIWVAHLALQPDGRIVVAASTSGETSSNDLTAYRFKTDGSTDASFSGDGVVSIHVSDDENVPGGLVVDADGRITVAGRAGSNYGRGGVFLARFAPTGVPDTGFAANGFLVTGIGFDDDRGSGIALQPDGKIVVAGDSNFDGNSARLVVLRYLAGTCGDFRTQAAYGEQCDDGNAVAGDGCEPDCTRTPVAVVVPPGGGTVTTDPLGEGATPEVPVQTAITTPNGGPVTIAPPAVPAAPEGMEVVGLQLQIEAPLATPEVPLSITLTVDASAIPPGVDPNRLDVTRDGVIVEDCTGPAGIAEPDPCVQSRSILADGDVQMTVLTSHASLWGMVLRGLYAGEQSCVNDVGKAATGVTKAQAKANAACLKGAANGKVPDAAVCVLADAGGKVGNSMQKTTGVAHNECVPPPPFGFTSADAVNQAAHDAEIGLLADLFGSNLDGAVAGDRHGAACQGAALKSVQMVFDAKAKNFLACAKAGLAGTSALMVTAGELAGCYETVSADLDGKIAKAAGKLASTLQSKCSGNTASLLPGVCGADGAPAHCLEQRAQCRICLTFNAMDGLEQNCDFFDDAVVNGSCG